MPGRCFPGSFRTREGVRGPPASWERRCKSLNLYRGLAWMAPCRHCVLFEGWHQASVATKVEKKRDSTSTLRQPRKGGNGKADWSGL